MLELKKIDKTYDTNEISVKALKDVSIKFRKKEFVSILGTSGSGKTTLLNIIGGLDDYTSGNLIINNRSTKKYNDNDWDMYRNHKVGFVFQSYNLISHQTALANVELSLTLSGVSKEERRQRAIDALKEVGLLDQIYKKPNQMSGGQVQRIAIARALVNNPDILLADEPTGALDSKTSVQIMDILKEISKTRLVIMVTHNPELAKKYSTRIVELSDGKIISDSNPYEKEEKEIKEEKSKTKKSFMSFKTALNLSFNNLKTKKGRTILTSFAGAIGIIGIALVMSISNGVENYINSVEEDTLSSYPITIESQRIDATSLLESMNSSKDEVNEEKETIVTNNIMGNMFELMTSKIETNDLSSFKNFIDNNKELKKHVTAIKYSYNLNLQIYKDGNEIKQVNPNKLFENIGYEVPESYTQMMGNVFTELLDNELLIEEQYEVLSGRLPKNYDEVVLIVDNNNKISDYTAYALGLKDEKELTEMMVDALNGKNSTSKISTYSYDELLDLKFKVLLNTDYYQKTNGLWKNMQEDEKYIKKVLKDALEIKIVGIVKPNENSILSSSSSYGNIGYKKELSEYVINKINESDIAKEQKASPNKSVITGLKFIDGEFSFDKLC